MSRNIEVTATPRPRRFYLCVEAYAKPIEQLPYSINVTSVARVDINSSDAAAHHARDCPAGSPFLKLRIVLVAGVGVPLASRELELWLLLRVRRSGYQRHVQQFAEPARKVEGGNMINWRS
jgi:hypothetical protein